MKSVAILHIILVLISFTNFKKCIYSYKHIYLQYDLSLLYFCFALIYLYSYYYKGNVQPFSFVCCPPTKISVLKGECVARFSPSISVSRALLLVLMLHAEDNAPHNQTLYCIVWTILSLTRGVGTPAPLSLTPGVGGWAGHCGVSKINQPSAESKKL